ncbi:MAG TPA: GntR family transcriptional regulator [Myxococcaceae bacterium]|nr:GntR family transcriptional regulator [Myxococcaceae bacterium]
MERLIRKTTAQQVAEAVELSILAGEFDRGRRLPPERKLAAMLGVCRLTLREGLNRLVARGILIAVPGLGTFISSVEMTQSIDLLASQYLMEKVPQRKVELVRHYLETRRFLLSAVLPAAAERATDAQLEWIIDGFVRMGGAAQFFRDLRKAAELEIRAIHIAAEKADLYHLWLMLNSLRDFFRVARDEIVAGARLDQYETRARELVDLLRRRDGEAIVRYIASEYAPGDRAQLAALERRLLKPRTTAAPASAPRDSNAVPSTNAQLVRAAPAASGGRLSAASEHVPDAAITASPPVHPAEGPEERAGNERAPRASDAQSTMGSDAAAGVRASDAGAAEDGNNAPLPRTDPASWHRWFIEWYHRNFQCNPWDNPDEVPPGPTIDDEPPALRNDPSDTLQSSAIDSAAGKVAGAARALGSAIPAAAPARGLEDPPTRSNRLADSTVDANRSTVDRSPAEALSSHEVSAAQQRERDGPGTALSATAAPVAEASTPPPTGHDSR